MLQQLRPSTGATVSMLQSAFACTPEPAPQLLPDAALLALALSFRCLEQDAAAAGGQPPHSDAAAAIFAVVSVLLAGHGSGSSLELSQPTLLRCLRIYQNALEREVVARIVGIGDSEASAMMKRALRSELSRHTHQPRR